MNKEAQYLHEALKKAVARRTAYWNSQPPEVLRALESEISRIAAEQDQELRNNRGYVHGPDLRPRRILA